MGPNPNAWCPYIYKKKRRFGHRERHAQREDDTGTQEEHSLQAKGLVRLPEARREAWSRDSDGPSPVDTLISASRLQKCDTIDFCFLSHLVCAMLLQQPQEPDILTPTACVCSARVRILLSIWSLCMDCRCPHIESPHLKLHPRHFSSPSI